MIAILGSPTRDGFTPVTNGSDVIGYLKPHRLGLGRRVTYWSVCTKDRTVICAAQTVNTALAFFTRKETTR